MDVTRTPRYDMETDRRGRLLTPVRPPQFDTLPIGPDTTRIAGHAAVIAAPTEWVTDVRILTDPVESVPGQWFVRWCTAAAYFASQETGTPVPEDQQGMVPVSRIWLVKPSTPRG